MPFRRVIGGLRPGVFSTRSLFAVGKLWLLVGGCLATVQADSSSWNLDNGGSWNAPANWNNGVPGTTSGTTSPDIATFDFTLTAARTVTVDANRNIGGITLGNTSAFGYTLSGGNLLLSNGGVIQTTSGNGNHTDTISSAIAIQGDSGSATFTAGASSPTSLLSIGAVTGVSTAGNTTTLYLNGSNSGNNLISGVIGNGAGGGNLAIVKTGAGNWLLNASNTFSGGLTIKEGTVTGGSSTNTPFGSGIVTLGDTSGSADASLLVTRHNVSLTNAIVLETGTTGTLTIGNGGNLAHTFTGGVTGNNNLTINESGNNNILTFATAAINNSGTITHVGSGTGTTLITGGIGANVTGILQNSATSGLTISTTALTLNSGGTTLTNNSSGTALLTLAGGTTGTGNLILNNNSATNGGIAVGSLALNHVGTVTNSGSGSGTTTINANLIGGNITGVIQDSATSDLVISNAQTFFTSGLTVKKGTVQLGNTLSAGSGSITLGDSAGGSQSASVLGTASQTFANAVVLAANTTGVLTLGTVVGGHTVNFSGGVTGNNNLALNNKGTATLTFQTGALNHSGTIANMSSGTGATAISAAIGTNVTGVTQDSSTSALTASGGLTVNSGGTTLTNNGGRIFTVSTGAVGGTGNLILRNNSSLASGITLSSAVNHTGSITNSGTGSTAPLVGTTVLSLDKNVLISGAIGSNVSTVTQDSATSVMELSVANTFSGSARVFSGSLILGLAGAASSSQILVGNTSGSADASLLSRGITLTNQILVQSGNTGVATIGSAGATNGAATTYSGQITLDKSVTLSSWNTSVTFSGLITGAGGISVVQSMGGSFSTSGQPFGISGGTIVLSRTDNLNTFAGDTVVRSGTLQLNGNGTASASLNGLLGSSANAILVGDTRGDQSARLILNQGAVNQTFSRNLTIEAGSGGLVGVGQIGSANAVLSGNVTLNKSGYLYGGTSGQPILTVSGLVSKGGSAIGATSITTSGGGVINLTNTGNNYDGGSVVGGLGALWGSGAGSLGTGNVVVEAGFLRLSDQVALASGKTVYTGPYGGISIGANSAAQIAYVDSVLDNASSGVIAMGVGISNVINLANFGNGLMFLGSDPSQNGYTYSAATLGANSDGAYRIGGGSLVTLSSGALQGATAKVIIGNPQSSTQGTGLSSMSGSVTLTGANTYGGGTEVNVGSTLRGKQQAISGSPFGSTIGALALNGGSLILENTSNSATSSSTAATTVGALSFRGSSSILIQGVTAGGGNNTLTVGEITRQGKGVLSIAQLGSTGTLGTNAFFKTTGTAPTTTSVTAAGNTTVAMAPTYFLDNVNANFLTYDGTDGFKLLNPYTTIAAAVADGNTGVVKLSAAETFSTGGNRSIAALGLQVLTANYSVLNASGADLTLTITTGGINYVGNNFSTVIGSANADQRINLNFNGQEAIINSTGGGNSSLTLNGAIVNATGITKSGTGPLVLRSNLSTFIGDVTILGGQLEIQNDLALGGSGDSLNNGLVLDGGRLTVDGTTTLSGTRTITIGANGGTLSNKSSGNITAVTTVVNSKITGTGSYLDVLAGAANTNNNNVTSVYTFTNAANDFIAPIFVGNVGGGGNAGRMALSFDTDSQLGNVTNTVNLIGGNSVLRYTGTGAISTTRGINFLEQGGALEVVDAGGTLTASGVIAGSGLFNKLGNGKLILTGANTYTANTLVTAGVLNIQHANALGATTAAISGNSGVSGGGVYVQEGAALEVQGGLVIGGSGGKTTYLNGSGIGNAGALRNVSGNNSNAGALVLQSASTIGSDAGRYTVSGVVSGEALTKVGAGALEFSAANTYVGGTIVTGGTLIVNNTTGSATGSGTVALGAGTTLGGAGSISGLVTTADLTTVIAPGNSPGTLTVGSLDASAGTSFSFELGTVSDLLVVTGAFTGSSFASGLSFSFADAGGLAAGNPYTLISFGSSSGLDYSDLVASVVPSGYELDLAFGTNGFLIDSSSLQVQFSAIPEPSLVSLIGLGLITLTIFRRRRA